MFVFLKIVKTRLLLRRGLEKMFCLFWRSKYLHFFWVLLKLRASWKYNVNLLEHSCSSIIALQRSKEYVLFWRAWHLYFFQYFGDWEFRENATLIFLKIVAVGLLLCRDLKNMFCLFWWTWYREKPTLIF